MRTRAAVVLIPLASLASLGAAGAWSLTTGSTQASPSSPIDGPAVDVVPGDTSESPGILEHGTTSDAGMLLAAPRSASGACPTEAESSSCAVRAVQGTLTVDDGTASTCAAETTDSPSIGTPDAVVAADVPPDSPARKDVAHYDLSSWLRACADGVTERPGEQGARDDLGIACRAVGLPGWPPPTNVPRWRDELLRTLQMNAVGRVWIDVAATPRVDVEAGLDAAFWTGGACVPMEAVVLSDPVTAGRRSGFMPPRPGEVLRLDRSIALDAIRRAGTAALRVALDVPEDRSVVAAAGSARLYVVDYDVEVSQEAYIADPCFSIAQDGLRVRAKVQRDALGNLSLDLAACVLVLADPIPTFSTCLFSGPVTASAPVVIQIPKLAAPRFHGSVPFAGNAAVVGLTDGQVLVVAPTGSAYETERARAWRPATPDPQDDSERWLVAVRAAGGDGISMASFDAEFRGDATEKPLESDVKTVTERLHAPATASVTSGPIEALRRVDVAVTLAKPLEPIAWDIPILGKEKPGPAARAQRAVSSLRFLLRRGEQGSRELTADLGTGPERWLVSVTRVVD